MFGGTIKEEDMHGPSFSDQRSEKRRPLAPDLRRTISDYWKQKLDVLENQTVPESEVIIPFSFFCSTSSFLMKEKKKVSTVFQGLQFYIQGYVGDSDILLKRLILKNGGRIKSLSLFFFFSL